MNNPFTDTLCPHCGEFVNPIYGGDCPNCGEHIPGAEDFYEEEDYEAEYYDEDDYEDDRHNYFSCVRGMTCTYNCENCDCDDDCDMCARNGSEYCKNCTIAYTY